MRLGALQCRVAGGGGEPELKEGILGAEGEVLGRGRVGVCSRARTQGVWWSDSWFGKRGWGQEHPPQIRTVMWMEWKRRWLNGVRQEGAASRGAGSYARKRGRRLQWQPRLLEALSGPGAAASDTREESEEAQRRDYLDALFFCPAAFLDGRLALDSSWLCSHRHSFDC